MPSLPVGIQPGWGVGEWFGPNGLFERGQAVRESGRPLHTTALHQAEQAGCDRGKLGLTGKGAQLKSGHDRLGDRGVNRFEAGTGDCRGGFRFLQLGRGSRRFRL